MCVYAGTEGWNIGNPDLIQISQNHRLSKAEGIFLTNSRDMSCPGLIWWLNLKFSNSKHRILTLFPPQYFTLNSLHYLKALLLSLQLLKPFRVRGSFLILFPSFSTWSPQQLLAVYQLRTKVISSPYCCLHARLAALSPGSGANLLINLFDSSLAS